MEKTVQQHTLTYINNKLELTAVKEVVSFEDSEVVILLAEGGIKILGHGLTVSQLDTTSGKTTISGAVGSIIYTNMAGKVPLLKRIFK